MKELIKDGVKIAKAIKTMEEAGLLNWDTVQGKLEKKVEGKLALVLDAVVPEETGCVCVRLRAIVRDDQGALIGHDLGYFYYDAEDAEQSDSPFQPTDALFTNIHDYIVSGTYEKPRIGAEDAEPPADLKIVSGGAA